MTNKAKHDPEKHFVNIVYNSAKKLKKRIKLCLAINHKETVPL